MSLDDEAAPPAPGGDGGDAAQSRAAGGRRAASPSHRGDLTRRVARGGGFADPPWPEDDDVPRREVAAAVDWFEEALSERDDVADDLLDPRYPLSSQAAAWCKAVDHASWNNQDWALGLWHVMLGQVLREQRVEIGNRWLDGRFHLLILAPSSSGKTLAADQARRVLEGVQLGPERVMEVRPILEATTAALIGSAERRRVKGQSVLELIPGLLESADILHWDEAEAIFHETSWNVNLLRVLNQTMNPIGSAGNVIGKELRGATNVVRPKCSLLMTAVDFLTIPEEILRCGFYQRVGVMRKVLTPEQRRKNRLREKDLIESGGTAERELGETTRYLEHLAGLYGVPRKWDFRGVAGMINLKYKKMLDAAGKNEVVRPYLEDFAERYADKLYILSMHNCATRTSGDGSGGPRVISTQDVARAWVVVKVCMGQFFHYVTGIAYSFDSLHRANIRRRVA